MSRPLILLLLTLLFVAGIACVLTAALGRGLPGPLPLAPELLNWLGLFVLTYAALVTLRQIELPWVGERLDRWLGEWIASVGAGFYGLMALATFIGLELRTLVDELAGIGAGTSDIGQWLLLNVVLDLGIESMMNSLQAALWPVELLSGRDGRTVMTFLALGWGLFWLGSRVFPQGPRGFGNDGEVPIEAELEATDAELETGERLADAASGEAGDAR